MRRRLPARVLLAVAVIAIVAGGVLAVRGWLAVRTGPDTVVRHYFAALERGDAAAALSYGTVPPGSRALVDDDVLRAQRRAAPIRSLSILSTRTAGDRASVELGYVLDFPDGPSTVAADVALHRSGGGWVLDSSAVATRLDISAARHRASIGGVRVPDGRMLVFPGAVPVRFDSPYLTATIGNGSITFGAPASIDVQVSLTSAGRRAMRSRLAEGLARCLTRGGSTCPQPDERYVPGSLRGRSAGPLRDVRIGLSDSSAGVITASATAAADVRFRRLDFTNGVRSGSGRVVLEVRAVALARAPLQLRWSQ